MLGLPVVSRVVLLNVIDYLNQVFTSFYCTDVVLIGDIAQFYQSKVAYASHVHFLVAVCFSKTGFTLTRDFVWLLLEFVHENIKQLRLSFI